MRVDADNGAGASTALDRTSAYASGNGESELEKLSAASSGRGRARTDEHLNAEAAGHAVGAMLRNGKWDAKRGSGAVSVSVSANAREQHRIEWDEPGMAISSEMMSRMRQPLPASFVGRNKDCPR